MSQCCLHGSSFVENCLVKLFSEHVFTVMSSCYLMAEHTAWWLKDINWRLLKATSLHVQLPWGAQSQDHRKRLHLIIPLSVERDKTFPLQPTCLSTLCLPLSPDPPVWPLLCLMLCQHHLPPWSRQPQKRTFLLSCRWLMWLRQEAATIPLHSPPSTTATTTFTALTAAEPKLPLFVKITFFWSKEHFLIDLYTEHKSSSIQTEHYLSIWSKKMVYTSP